MATRRIRPANAPEADYKAMYGGDNRFFTFAIHHRSVPTPFQRRHLIGNCVFYVDYVNIDKLTLDQLKEIKATFGGKPKAWYFTEFKLPELSRVGGGMVPLTNELDIRALAFHVKGVDEITLYVDMVEDYHCETCCCIPEYCDCEDEDEDEDEEEDEDVYMDEWSEDDNVSIDSLTLDARS